MTVQVINEQSEILIHCSHETMRKDYIANKILPAARKTLVEPTLKQQRFADPPNAVLIKVLATQPAGAVMQTREVVSQSISSSLIGSTSSSNDNVTPSPES